MADSSGIKTKIERVVDINPHKQGKFLPGTGHPVVSPESLQNNPPEVVIVMNAIYAEEVGQTLAELGLHPELLTADDVGQQYRRMKESGPVSDARF